MRIPTLALVAALVLAHGAADLRGQDVPTVAVMDFSSFMMGDGGASVNLGKAISAMLVTEFSGREGMRIVERAQLQDLIREQDLSLSGRIEEADAIEVGKMLGVQYVLHGQVTSIADNLRMDIRAVDVETSEIVSVMKKSDQTTELFSVVVDLADEFGEALDLVPPSERPEVESIPVAATIAFSRAVAYEDERNIEQAIQFYEQTLEIHPGHRDARRALERLRGGNRP
ncbi:MAG: FlgO family outer membrane protein [Longimicrobiales bacterium]|nr:FlgO family outer membrane protein [Longimicrobiales bacterium]